MQTLTEKAYKLGPPGGVFDETVVFNLFPNISDGARKLVVHRAVQSGEVLRLKPGLFCLAEEFRKSHLHPFALAAMLHSPSHISLESALHFHGLIPEAVVQITSVSVRRSRTFQTPLGWFGYERVPANNPRAGVKLTRLDKNSAAFIASALRAIADLVYLRRSVGWPSDGIDFLVDSMRIEIDDLKQISFEQFDEICSSLRNKRTRTYLEGLRRELES